MFKIDPKVKKVCGTLMLIGTAISSVVSVFDENRRNKEFEDMKKAIEELQKK